MLAKMMRRSSVCAYMGEQARSSKKVVIYNFRYDNEKELMIGG